MISLDELSAWIWLLQKVLGLDMLDYALKLTYPNHSWESISLRIESISLNTKALKTFASGVDFMDISWEPVPWINLLRLLRKFRLSLAAPLILQLPRLPLAAG
ncbi:hypothetical protein LINPERHAP1_LOCUS28748 [Linum perenne]